MQLAAQPALLLMILILLMIFSGKRWLRKRSRAGSRSRAGVF